MTHSDRWTDRKMMLKFDFLYDNKSTSLSNEYSTVHENTDEQSHEQWTCFFLSFSLILATSACSSLHLLQVQASPSRWECSYQGTTVFLCLPTWSLVCCQALTMLLEVCWEHMGHLSKNSHSRAKTSNNHFHSRGERERTQKRLWDWKINSLSLVHLIELICQVNRGKFPINTFLLEGREDSWQVKHRQLHEFAGWESVKNWQTSGSEVTAFGKWTLGHVVISANSTSSLSVKCLYFHKFPTGIWAVWSKRDSVDWTLNTQRCAAMCLVSSRTRTVQTTSVRHTTNHIHTVTITLKMSCSGWETQMLFSYTVILLCSKVAGSFSVNVG